MMWALHIISISCVIQTPPLSDFFWNNCLNTQFLKSLQLHLVSLCNYVYLQLCFLPWTFSFYLDISFIAPVRFPGETFTPDLMNKNSKIFQALANKIRYNVSFSYIYPLFLFVKCNLTVYLISIPYSVFLSRLSLFCSSTKEIPCNFSLLPIWFLLVQRLVSWMFPSFLAPRSSLDLVF